MALDHVLLSVIAAIRRDTLPGTVANLHLVGSCALQGMIRCVPEVECMHEIAVLATGRWVLIRENIKETCLHHRTGSSENSSAAICRSR